MATFVVSYERESGEAIEDLNDRGTLSRLVGGGHRRNWEQLGFLDPYGDTKFNRIQMTGLIADLEILKAEAIHKEDIEIIDRVIDLAKQCREDYHRYLVFYGD